MKYEFQIMGGDDGFTSAEISDSDTASLARVFELQSIDIETYDRTPRDCARS